MKTTRVMIVEDERIIALDLQNQLKNMNYQVCRVVASGALAIQYASDLKPDIVLMDIHLEGTMDGIDAAREIHRRFKIPIIFLTAYAEEATLQRAVVALPYGYLVKPVSPLELNATLKMAVVRHVAAQQFEEDAGRLRKALEVALLNVWEWDTETDNLNVYNMVSSNQSEMNAPICESLDSFYNRVDIRDLDNVKEKIEQIRHQDNSINVIFRTRSMADKARWIEVHAKRVDNNAGVSGKVLGVMQDITERRNDELRLRQAMVVFDATAEGILILDNNRKIIATNPAFSQLTGYSPEEILSWTDTDSLYEQQHSPYFYDKLNATEKGQWHGNVRYCKKNKQFISAWENISLVRDAENNICHYVIVFSDIGTTVDLQEKPE